MKKRGRKIIKTKNVRLKKWDSVIEMKEHLHFLINKIVFKKKKMTSKNDGLFLK